MFGTVSQGSCEISTSHGARPFDKYAWFMWILKFYTVWQMAYNDGMVAER